VENSAVAVIMIISIWYGYCFLLLL